MEGLFELAEQLEARLAKARGKVEKLTPSLLARAFAGQLVLQDPNAPTTNRRRDFWNGFAKDASSFSNRLHHLLRCIGH